MNPSYYLFNNQVLFQALTQVKPNNVKQEYYLTDALSVIIATGHKVVAVTAVRPEEAVGVNSRAQLSVASKIMQHRIQQELMENGVTIVDPDNTWIDARAKIGQDTVIEPFVYIHGAVKIGRDCRIGPFAFLREGTVIGDDVVLGVFTELKNAIAGRRSPGAASQLLGRCHDRTPRERRGRVDHRQLRRREREPDYGRRRLLHRLRRGPDRTAGLARPERTSARARSSRSRMSKDQWEIRS